jgi:hypothetical protein
MGAAHGPGGQRKNPRFEHVQQHDICIYFLEDHGIGQIYIKLGDGSKFNAPTNRLHHSILDAILFLSESLCVSICDNLRMRR